MKNSHYIIPILLLLFCSFHASGHKKYTSEPPVTTKLRDADCGITLENLTLRVYALPINDASQYKFSLYENDNFLEERTSYPSSYVLTGFSKMELGKNYTIKVSARVNNVWTENGEACSITTPNQERPTFRDAYIDSKPERMNYHMYINRVKNASKYKYELVSADGNNVIHSYETGYDYLYIPYFNGIEYGKQYIVRAYALVNGVWSAP